MFTLCIRYTLDPNKLAAFRGYCSSEQAVIRRCGGAIVGYFLPTDYAGPTNEAYGLIEFPSLADYERYRHALAGDPEHQTNATALERSCAVIATTRSFLDRAPEGGGA